MWWPEFPERMSFFIFFTKTNLYLNCGDIPLIPLVLPVPPLASKVERVPQETYLKQDQVKTAILCTSYMFMVFPRGGAVTLGVNGVT